MAKGAKSLAGIMGGMGRRAQNHYDQPELPWQSYWRFQDEDDPSKGSETVFVMSKGVAEEIRGARRNNQKKR